MKKTLISVIAAIICFGLVTTGICADEKIGVFELQKIMDESSAGKMMKLQLKEKYTGLQNDLKKEQDELEVMQKALEREALVLSAQKSNEKKRAFRIRFNDFQEMKQSFPRNMKALEDSFKKRVITDIFKIIDKIGKEEGYTIIMEKKTAGVFFHTPASDITDKIIKIYNVDTSKKQKQ